jgi:hypothetical protein
LLLLTFGDEDTIDLLLSINISASWRWFERIDVVLLLLFCAKLLLLFSCGFVAVDDDDDDTKGGIRDGILKGFSLLPGRAILDQYAAVHLV